MIIPDSVRYLLIAEKAELEDKIRPMQGRIEEINTMLQYEEHIDWNQRIMACLNHVNTPLTTNEMLKYIFYNSDNKLKDGEKRKAYIKQLSLYLHRLRNKGVLCTETIKGYKGNIYGLAEWKDNPEFQYIFLTRKKSLIEEKKRFFAEMQ